jgi:hypothetical protein
MGSGRCKIGSTGDSKKNFQFKFRLRSLVPRIAIPLSRSCLPISGGQAYANIVPERRMPGFPGFLFTTLGEAVSE